MKGPSVYICLLFSFPSFLSPLSPRSALLRSAPTANRPVCHRSRRAARWRPISGWLTGWPDPEPRDPLRERSSRQARQATTLRQDPPVSFAPISLSPSLLLFFPLPPALRSRSIRNSRAPAYRFSTAAGREDGGDRAAVAATRWPISGETLRAIPRVRPARARAIDDESGQSGRRDGDVARYIRRTPTPTPTPLLLSL